MKKNKKELARIKRHKRLRRKIIGTPGRPRMVVHRSLKNLSVQIVDDINGVTLCSVSTSNPEIRKKVTYGGNIKAAEVLGETASALAKAKGIRKVVFDRGGYIYHGRIKALADNARKGDLKF